MFLQQILQIDFDFEDYLDWIQEIHLLDIVEKDWQIDYDCLIKNKKEKSKQLFYAILFQFFLKKIHLSEILLFLTN